MGAFTTGIQTPTVDHGAADDHRWPDFKALDPKQIAVPTGLRGVPSCTLGTKVFGDQQEIVFKNRGVAIVLNDSLTIGVNKFESVEAESTLLVKGGRTTEITPTEFLAVHGSRQVWVDGQDTEHYLVHREIHEPVERIEHSEKAIEYGSAKAETFGSTFETTGFAVVVDNLKAELEMFVTQNKAISGKVEPLQVHLEAMSAKLGALTLAAKVKLNALINFALSSPFS